MMNRCMNMSHLSRWLPGLAVVCMTAFTPLAADVDFIDRLQLPASTRSGFTMDGYSTWCPSVIKGDDGKYYMFASRFPGQEWKTKSQIVRAVAPHPESSFVFQEVVVDAEATNPYIVKAGDTFVIYYHTYTTDPNQYWTGMATSKSLFGPWTEHAPLFRGSNPAAWIHEDGKILLLTKWSGSYWADSYKGPYIKIEGRTGWPGLEDMFLWHTGEHYEVIATDLSGKTSGVDRAGLHITSPDGVHWSPKDPPMAYPRKLSVTDGNTLWNFDRWERPFLLIENNIPTHMFVANRGDGYFGWRTYCIPLSAGPTQAAILLQQANSRPDSRPQARFLSPGADAKLFDATGRLVINSPFHRRMELFNSCGKNAPGIYFFTAAGTAGKALPKGCRIGN